jgi:RNA polymerase sigma-70 factor, ECF subfamily
VIEQSVDAAHALVDRYGDRIFQLALRLTGAQADAGEVSERVLSAAIRKVDTFDDQTLFTRWIDRTTAQTAYELLRARRSPLTALTALDVLPPFQADGRHVQVMDDWSGRLDSPEERGRLRRILADALDALPADHRAALLLRDAEGRSDAEIGETLGINAFEVRSRVHRSRLFVRNRLSERLALQP